MQYIKGEIKMTKTAYDIIAKLKKDDMIPVNAKTGVARIDGNYVAILYVPRNAKQNSVLNKIPMAMDNIPIMIKPLEDFATSGL